MNASRLAKQEAAQVSCIESLKELFLPSSQDMKTFERQSDLQETGLRGQVCSGKKKKITQPLTLTVLQYWKLTSSGSTDTLPHVACSGVFQCYFLYLKLTKIYQTIQRVASISSCRSIAVTLPAVPVLTSMILLTLYSISVFRNSCADYWRLILVQQVNLNGDNFDGGVFQLR